MLTIGPDPPDPVDRAFAQGNGEIGEVGIFGYLGPGPGAQSLAATFGARPARWEDRDAWQNVPGIFAAMGVCNDAWVADVGSLNGTYVNRERTEEAELDDGDEIQVGKFKLVFVHGTGDV